MCNSQEATAFYLAAQRREAEVAKRLEQERRIEARKFLSVPELPTGFGALDSGRGPLVQIPDFEVPS